MFKFKKIIRIFVVLMEPRRIGELSKTMKNRFVFLIVLMFSCTLFAQENDSVPINGDTVFPNRDKFHLNFNGQISGWTLSQFVNPVNTQLAARFVPALIGTFRKFDFEASANTQGALNYTGTHHDTTTYLLKPYRVWIRYAGDNWEVRGGLQKINFGQAQLFRPLMWFDRMDVRDPLQLTGVYALLGKYFFANNANVWLWTLLGNRQPKGFEILGSVPQIPEIGGRVQFPIGRGELAFSTHYRQADMKTLLPIAEGNTALSETRFGADGKWDVGIGLWFETSAFVTQKNNFGVFPYQHFLNVGADYTIPIGNGLGVTAEYFRYHTGDAFLSGGYNVSVTGTMLSYPVSVLDNLSAMIFYVGKQNLWFNYLSYSRTYDDWQLYLIGFWNPETNLPIASFQNGSRSWFTGKGVQFIVNYNF